MNFYQSQTIEDLIKSSIVLGKKSAKNFETVKCRVCNDYKERGGFKFENSNIIYSCFNCGTKAVYNSLDSNISSNMKKVLISFGIQESLIDDIVSTSFFNKKDKVDNKTIEIKKSSIFPNEIDLPIGSENLNQTKSIWGEIAKEYLKLRHIDFKNYNFYISENEKYIGRLIVPCYFRNKLIYWQGRALDDSIQPRYKNCLSNKDNIFFNMDEIFRYTNEPLIITEGWTDARLYGNNGVSILGSNLTEFKETQLKKVTNRKIIFIIDKNEPGYKLANIAIKNNWNIHVFPDSIEDANDSLIKMGKLWTLNNTISESCTGFAAKLLLETKVKPFCKK